MADEQDKWLDRDAAERLLRGEPLEAVDADTQGRAKRLADALGALAFEPTPISAELPGEAAALAAFQQARAGRDGEVAQLGRRERPGAAAHSADAGLVRLGRPAPGRRGTRWGRPVRLGVAAALAAGMIGGVAVAAGTGVLPTPFRDDSPNPAATISAAQTPPPLLSPSPGASRSHGSEAPIPGATTSAPAGAGSGDDEARGSGTPSGQPGPSGAGRSARSREWWAKTRAYCRAVLDGKSLESGRRRVLVDAAGGGRRVRKYCKGVLEHTAGVADKDRGGQDQQDDRGSDSGQGVGGGSGSGSGGGDNGGDGDGHTGSGGKGGHHGGYGILAPSPHAVRAPLRPHGSPSATAPAPTAGPTYSALLRLSAL